MTHPHPKKILLLGGNGRTGRAILDRALNDGIAVTALVRGEDRLADVHHARLDVQLGSPCDPAILEEILPGHDLVISTLGPRWPSKAASAIYPDSAAAIVAAMQRVGVDRLLVTSSALLFPDGAVLTRALRWLVPHVVEGARQMEAQIRGSSLDWTIARTSFLNNDSATDHRLGVGALPEGGGAVSRAAVAQFLLQAGARAEHSRQVVGLCG